MASEPHSSKLEDFCMEKIGVNIFYGLAAHPRFGRGLLSTACHHGGPGHLEGWLRHLRCASEGEKVVGVFVWPASSGTSVRSELLGLNFDPKVLQGVALFC